MMLTGWLEAAPAPGFNKLAICDWCTAKTIGVKRRFGPSWNGSDCPAAQDGFLFK